MSISERKKELMELRFKGAVGQLENPARISGLRKEVARLGTIFMVVASALFMENLDATVLVTAIENKGKQNRRVRIALA